MCLLVTPLAASTIGTFVCLLLPMGTSGGEFAVAGFVPLASLAVVAWYRRRRGTVRLGPYAPFAVVAIAFAGSMVDLAIYIANDPDHGMGIIPVLPFGLWFLLPFLALLGGLANCLGSPSRTDSIA
jgi:hypothetical protein